MMLTLVGPLRMKRLLLLILIALGGLPAVALPSPKPNVIVVMTDDQGYSDLGCHGHPLLETPNMDELSARSVRFTDFHVDPFCTPTRAALMTGRMSHRTGATATYGKRNFLRRDEVLMAEYFKASGYQTGTFGKWHLGGNYPYRPMDRGFDEWLGLGNGGLSIADDFWDNDRMNDRYWHNGEMVSRNGFSTDVYFQAAMDFLKQGKQHKKPSFVYLPTNVPHNDNHVPEAWLQPYLKKGCYEVQAAYYASIQRVDWNLGRLVKFLEDENLEDTTLLVFLTDNGTVIPLRKPKTKIDKVSGRKGMKGSLYEGGHRVPCFVSGPEQLLGEPRDIDAFTSHVDLLPTFADLCGLVEPERDLLPLDGRSLKPLLTGDGSWDDRTFFLHSQNGLKGPAKYTEAVVMTPEWRLILNQPEEYELYRIKEDPSQVRDVGANRPDVVRQLLGEYDAYWETLGHDRAFERPQLSSHATLKLTAGWHRQVRKGIRQSGRWELDLAEAGTYRFELRRWPREVTGVAMTGGLPPAEDPDTKYIGNQSPDIPGVALDITAAQLRVSEQDAVMKEVSKDAESVLFDVELKEGPVDVEAMLIKGNGKRTGAYYVYAWRI